MKKGFVIVFLTCWFYSPAQQRRWNMDAGGGISWKVETGSRHTDHMEMSGRKVSAMVSYGIDSTQRLVLRRKLVFPMLRIVPNDTRGSLQESFDINIIDSVRADGQQLREQPVSFFIDGYLRSVSRTNTPVSVERTLYPSVDKPACLEKYVLTNTGDRPTTISIPAFNKDRKTVAAKGVDGVYILNYEVYEATTARLLPGETYTFYMVLSARKAAEAPYHFSADYELNRRRNFVSGLDNTLVLHTPNDTLDRMFAFAKIRAAESIFDTRAGLMHAPGGGSYYAAIWANDEAEYVGPFFPFLGNTEGVESARNSYRLFAGYLNSAYKPLPSSIIAEGTDIWDGAGDRGDQAMIAYGASRFALANGDSAEARRLWPLITWCLEYLERKKTAEGVIASTSDELEGRFPTGKINLSTNCLAYGALISAGKLAGALGKEKDAVTFSRRATELKEHIERYFGAKVQGYDTYRYYEGNSTLRSWICLPLVMGIFDRKDQTIQALLSKYLWTKDGILTESGSETFWDRSTLYAFRGLFYAGATDTSLKYFNYYSSMRLLGEHVPYAVEAWPEGDQRHLSAESGLYCRTITEGLFGIEPTGFNSFTIQPRLPKGWNRMSLEHIKAFQQDMSIIVTREGESEKIRITTPGAPSMDYNWDGKEPLAINLPVPGRGVSFRSTDTTLEKAFSWAKTMALHYQAAPGAPVGPWYESALPPRYAFCMRDVSHQCIGAEILGMHRENRNMFSKFTTNISASKDWCSWWEIDRYDRPSPSDYRSDKEFWYNLNANFDLMDACWRSWLWTGDSIYLKDPAFLNFYHRSANDYIRKWSLEPGQLLTRPAYPNAPTPFNIEDAFDRCRGLPSYSEGIPDLKMGVDLVAALYRGLSSYAAIQKANGAPAAPWLQKAESYRQHIEADWWDDQVSRYRTHYTNKGQFGKAEGETFLLWFDALKDPVRRKNTITHIQSMDLNVENLSYLPLQYYRFGQWEAAHALIRHLADPATKRREYPEVSYGLVEAVVQGLMGVEPNALNGTVSTLYRSADTARSELNNLPVLKTTLTILHDGPTRSAIHNTGRQTITWKARFYGDHTLATVNGSGQTLKKEKEDNGLTISYLEVRVLPGEEVAVSLR